MANTGLINIDVNKTVDLVSNNGINIQTLAGNVAIDSSDRIELFSNNEMLIESDTSIDIAAPIIRINGDSLILTGTNSSFSNTFTEIDERVQVLEANVYNANTGLLATRAYIATVEIAAANSTAALALRTDTLEATVYDANTGLAATRAYISDVEQAFANTTDALALSIESIVATSGIGNRTYVQSEPPTQPTFTLITGDLWFDSNDGYKMYRWSGLAWIEVADQRIDGLLAAVIDEASARANATSAIATTVNGVVAAIGNTQASVTEERIARVANDEAFATQLLTINSRFANVEASITEEAITRASADEGLAQTIETIIVGSGVAGARTFVQSLAPGAPGIGDLWFDSDDNYRLYRWNGIAWENVEDLRIANTLSAFTTERIARVANDTATATRIDGVLTRVANAESFISTVQTTSANSIAALANQVSQLVVTAGSNTGTITYYQSATPVGGKTGDLWFDTDDNFKLYRLDNANTWVNVSDSRINVTAAGLVTEQGARVANDAALTTRIDTAFTRIGNSEAVISTLQATTANQIAAQANSISTLSTRVFSNSTFSQATAPSAPPASNGSIWYNTSAGNRPFRWNGSSWVEVSDGRIAQSEANITSLQGTVTTLNSSFATLQSTVNARVGSVESYVTTQIAAQANNTTALANQFNTISANVGRLSANVTTLATTVAGLSNTSAQFALRVTAGKVVGFTATATNTQSDFVVQADTFRVVNSSGSGDSPFSIIGANTYIKNAFIENLSVGTGKIAPGAISTTQSFAGPSRTFIPQFGYSSVVSTPVVEVDSTGYGKALINFYAVMNGSAHDDTSGRILIYVFNGSGGFQLISSSYFSFGVDSGGGRMRIPMALAATIEGIQRLSVVVDVQSVVPPERNYAAARAFTVDEAFVTITGIKR